MAKDSKGPTDQKPEDQNKKAEGQKPDQNKVVQGLVEEVRTLAGRLGESPSVSGMSEGQLRDMAANLRKRLAPPVDGNNPTPALGGPPKPTAVAKRGKAPNAPFYVAEGKAVTCCAGTVDALKPIRWRDLCQNTNDQAQVSIAKRSFDRLIEVGVVVVNRHFKPE